MANPAVRCLTGPVSWHRTLTIVHTGLIGFDAGTGSCAVRPELLRLAKRGKRITDTDRVALAA